MNSYFRLFKIAFNAELTTDKRIFAGLEAICKPLSMFAVMCIPLTLLLRGAFGFAMPPWFSDCAFPILLSAAVGYLTNWIAIEMLFKPYEKTRLHILSILTAGIWQQGLIPKNKEQIAASIGETAEQELLQPEVLATDLCGMAGCLLDDESIQTAVKNALREQVLKQLPDIVQVLLPKLEKGIADEIGTLLTAEHAKAFIDTYIGPRLNSEQSREKLSRILIHAIDSHSAEAAAFLRPRIQTLLMDICKERFGFIPEMILQPIVDGILDKVLSPEVLGNGIRSWLGNPETQPMLKEKMSDVITALHDCLHSPDSDSELQLIINQIHQQLTQFLHRFLEKQLGTFLQVCCESDDLWDGLIRQLPALKPQVDAWVRTYGMPRIIDNLNIRGRIEAAIRQQDMKQFHDMINRITEQHLGAIQVLGFLLGGIAGALFVFISRL